MNWHLASYFDPGNRRGLFWRLQFIGWGSTLFVAGGVVGFTYWPAADTMILGTFRSLFGFAITSLVLRPILRYIRQHRPGFSWLTMLGAFLLCGTLALVDTLATSGLGQFIHADLEKEGLRQFLAISIFLRWALYGFWSLLYFGINFWLDTQHDQLQSAQREAAARSSELQMLRAQVNPHFLFNALNSILAESGNQASVRRITLALADYLRFSLQQHHDTELLGVELSALENYLRVEKARFEENLEYDIEADSASRQTLAPVALIQPLLENAIKYGQRSAIRPLRITISAALERDMLIVAVVNTGEWIAPETNPSTRTGLANLLRRLHLLYGETAFLTAGAENDKVCARVTLPINRREKMS